MTIEIETNTRPKIFRSERCRTACPIKQVALQTKGDLKGVQEACIEAGLTPSNDTYGEALPPELRTRLEGVIFIADCTKGAIATNDGDCGSILAVDQGESLSEEEDSAVRFVRANWFLNNKM